MTTAYLLLGSNMGKRENYLSRAREMINATQAKDKEQATWIRAQSSIYNTSPWGNKNQDDFLNQAVCIETKLSAEELLKAILSIEKKMGRVRNQKSQIPNIESNAPKQQPLERGAWNPKLGTFKWQPRIIDIDILFFNEEILNSASLQIPHPHLHERKFALVPLAEIAGKFIHPVLKKSVTRLLEECTDTLRVCEMQNT